MFSLSGVIKDFFSLHDATGFFRYFFTLYSWRNRFIELRLAVHLSKFSYRRRSRVKVRDLLTNSIIILNVITNCFLSFSRVSTLQTSTTDRGSCGGRVNLRNKWVSIRFFVWFLSVYFKNEILSRIQTCFIALRREVVKIFANLRQFYVATRNVIQCNTSPKDQASSAPPTKQKQVKALETKQRFMALIRNHRKSYCVYTLRIDLFIFVALFRFHDRLPGDCITHAI